MRDYRLRELMAGLKSGSSHIAIIIQKGEGCDYTCGCGVAIRILNVEESGLKLAVNELLEEYGNATEVSPGEYIINEDNENSISYVLVVKLNGFSFFDIEEAREKSKEFWNKKKNDKIEAKERAEFDRLSKKFSS